MKQPLQVRAILALVLVAAHHSLAFGPLAGCDMIWGQNKYIKGLGYGHFIESSPTVPTGNARSTQEKELRFLNVTDV